MAIMNGIPFPGVTSQDPVGEDNILYSAQGLKKIGLTFAKNATAGADSDGIVAAGTLVGRITASKKGGIYDDTNSTTGVGTAIGVLLDTIDISAGDALGNVAYGDIFLMGAIVGADESGNYLTDLNGRKVTFGDIEVLIF
jgi:hypothetical protein